MKSKLRQAGFSLLEIVMVAGIIIVLSVAAIVAYQSAQQATNMNTAVSNLNSLTASIRNTFATQGDYTGLTNAVVLSSNSLPENMRVSAAGTTIKSPFANDGVDVAPANVGGTANDGFKITFKNVTGRQCQDFVNKMYRHYETVQAGSTTVTSVATAASACGGSATAKTTVSFSTR